MEGVGKEDSKKIKRTIFDVAEEIFHQARKYFGNAENSKLERNAFISKIPPPLPSPLRFFMDRWTLLRRELISLACHEI